MIPEPRRYRVSPAARKPLIQFMRGSLEAAKCRVIYCSEPNVAPFVITFETPTAERMGVVA